MKKRKKNFKKIFLAFLIIVVLLFTVNNSVHAEGAEHGSGSYCMTLNVNYNTNERAFPQNKVTSIKVNNNNWVSGDFYNGNIGDDHNIWTIEIIAGGSGNENLPNPFVSTAGGFDQYGTYQAIPNPDADDVEDKFDESELVNAINDFLENLRTDRRYIFVRRYWYLDSIADIAENCSLSEDNVMAVLSRTRKKLKEHLKRKVGE